MKLCRKCGGKYPDVFFRQSSSSRKRIGVNYKMSTCIGCELTTRTEAKADNRAYDKAKWAIDRHALVFISRGIVKSRSELVEKYGWKVAQMAHDIEHSFGNGCPYCQKPFETMPHGLADLTLDIINPNDPPYYRVNVRWVCISCNSEKQRTPPDKWGEKLLAWEMWHKQQIILATNPWAGLPLFEDIQ